MGALTVLANVAGRVRFRTAPVLSWHMTVKLYAMTCGRLGGPFGHLMEGAEGTIELPIPSFLIEHPKGRALYDTGMHPQLRTEPTARLKRQVDRWGLEALNVRERRRPRMPNQIGPHIEQRIVAFALAHPGFGPDEPVPATMDALLARHAQAALACADGAPIVLFGHSAGGWAAHGVAAHLESAHYNKRYVNKHNYPGNIQVV